MPLTEAPVIVNGASGENIENPFAKTITDQEQEEEWETDMVILAAGNRPDDSLYNECRQIQAAPEIHNIADSFAPGRVFEATKAAFLLATAL